MFQSLLNFQYILDTFSNVFLRIILIYEKKSLNRIIEMSFSIHSLKESLLVILNFFAFNLKGNKNKQTLQR